jgi:hypothetical protein
MASSETIMKKGIRKVGEALRKSPQAAPVFSVYFRRKNPSMTVTNRSEACSSAINGRR